MAQRLKLERIDTKGVVAMLVGTLIFLLITATWAYTQHQCTHGEPCTFGSWFNGGALSWNSILLGFGSGLAFGAIDNSLLLFGISTLDSLFQRLPGGTDAKINAAYGNAFSSSISGLGAAFVGQVIVDKSGVAQTPLWSQALGILLGGLVGILIPSLIMQSIGR